MKSQLRDFRGVGKPVGAAVMGFGATIVLCALVGFLFDLFDPPKDSKLLGGEWPLLASAAITLGSGLVMFLWGRRYAGEVITRREAILSVALFWFSAGVFGALPFIFGAGMSFPDAFFESVSGLTTTGATVITNIETGLGQPLLLWRSLIQWLGGMGIVVLFVAIFPNIGAGGKHMFGEEVPGTTSEGLRPRIAETSRVLWQFYAAFTALEVLALYLLDLSLFEAICHAFTTMSTGGFSTRDASIAAFESAAVELTIAAFMLVGSVNYGVYYAAVRGRTLRVLIRSVEFRSFVAIVAISTAIIAIGIIDLHDGNLFKSFRYAVFMVATTISSTGYGTDDYMAYPTPTLFVVVVLMFVGGCVGSTAGGIKIERVVLMGKMCWAEIRRSFRPSLVHVVRMGRNVVAQSTLSDVAVFFIIYMLALGGGTAAITILEDISLPAAFGAVLTSISNMGPAPFHPGDDNFAAYGGLSKLLFSFIMLLGRLEFFALLALLVPGFWRR